MKIRPDQMEAMAAAASSDFHRRLKDFLRQELPDETASMGDEALLTRIVESERRAGMYTIKSESGIAQWVCLTFHAGSEFDDSPEVRAFLSTPVGDTSAEDRLNDLIDQLAADEGLE